MFIVFNGNDAVLHVCNSTEESEHQTSDANISSDVRLVLNLQCFY